MIVREAETIIKMKIEKGMALNIGANHNVKRKRKGSEQFIIAKKTSGFVAFAKVSREAKMSRHGSVFANKGEIVQRHQGANKMAANLECESRIYI